MYVRFTRLKKEQTEYEVRNIQHKLFKCVFKNQIWA